MEKDILQDGWYYYKLNPINLSFLTKENDYKRFQKFINQKATNWLVFKSDKPFKELKDKGGILIELYTGNILTIVDELCPDSSYRLEFNTNNKPLCIMLKTYTNEVSFTSLDKPGLLSSLNTLSSEFKKSGKIQVVQDFDDAYEFSRMLIEQENRALINATTDVTKYSDQILERRKQPQMIN